MCRLFFPLVLSIFIAGCSADKSGNGGFETKNAPLEKRTKYRTFVSDEELKTQKELARIEAQKSIEIKKIKSETRLKELELEKEKELALLREKERMLKIEHEQAMQRYMLLGAIVLLLLAGGAMLWYFDKRRKDKLRAYEDNLKKYFHQKENEARVKIAEKILDTVASKDLGNEQRTKLIEALHGPTSETKNGKNTMDPAQLQNGTEEAILIEKKESEEDGDKR